MESDNTRKEDVKGIDELSGRKDLIGIEAQAGREDLIGNEAQAGREDLTEDEAQAESKDLIGEEKEAVQKEVQTTVKKHFSLSSLTGEITDDKISLVSCGAMLLFIMSAAIMAGMAIRKKSIDFIMNSYPDIIKYYVLPLMAIMISAVYLMVIGKMIADRKNFFKVLKRNPVFIIFTAAVILMVFSQIYNGMDWALSGFCSSSLTETFPMEMTYFVFILFGATQVRKESHKRFVIRTQIIVSAFLVIAAFLLWQTMTESKFFYDWYPRFSSIFSNTNYYTYYLAFSVPLAGAAYLYEKSLFWKIVAACSFIANSVALSFNQCMGGWVGASLAMVFIVVSHLIIEKKVNWQALILVVVYALCLYIPSHVRGGFEDQLSQLGMDVTNIITGSEEAAHAGSDRWILWKQSLDVANENAIWGIGFEGVAYWGFKGTPQNIRPHNEFIQYALFHGYPMMILYFIGCFGVFIRALRKKAVMNGATLVSLSAAFGYLVSSFFGMTLFSTAAYLFIFLGMAYVRDDDGDILES